MVQKRDGESGEEALHLGSEVELLKRLSADLDRYLDDQDEVNLTTRISAFRQSDPDYADRLESVVRGLSDESFLGQSCADVLPSLMDPGSSFDPASWLGKTVGRWRLDSLAGRGGMGAVFRAQRADGQFEQTAAVKLLASTRPDFERQFVTERQILARLEHPNIARLIDGGTSEQGVSYLVAEFIDGRPIDQWADQMGMDLGGRLDLFADVCAAVHFAHRNLIVHRDLKPANVLVTEGGTAKVVDFGVAHLGNSEDQDEFDGLAPLSLGFAAPEQFTGEAISTATDVYSLGCLLSCLLIGSSPWNEVEGDRPDVLFQRMSTGQITLPSRLALTVSGFSPRERRERSGWVRGDLDAIIRRCLSVNPKERYGTAAELAEEIVRFRTSFPVKARIQSKSYRFRRLLRRRGLLLAATCLAGLLLLSGGRLLLDRVHEAEASQARAEKIMSFVQEVLRPEELTAPGAHPASLLEIGVKRARERFADEPEIEAAVLESLGNMLSKLEAHDVAREALIRSVALRRADSDITALIATMSKLAWAEAASGNADRGLELLDEALLLAEGEPGTHDLRVADSLYQVGFFEIRAIPPENVRRQQSLGHLQESVAIYREAPKEARAMLPRALFAQGLATSESSERLELLMAAVDMMRQEGSSQSELAHAVGDLALIFEGEGFPDEAVKHAQEAVELMTDDVGRGNLERLKLLNNLAGVLRDAGHFAQAEPLYAEVLELRRRLVPDDAGAIAYPLFGLGKVQVGLGRFAEAETNLRMALELVESKGWWRRSVAVRFSLVESLRGQDDWEESTKLLEELEVELKERLPESPDLERARRLLIPETTGQEASA